MSLQMRTIRRWGLALALGALLGLAVAPPPCEARSKGRTRSKAKKNTRFYDFDDLLIDGEFRKPATLYTRALKSPRFERLLRLQKSFLPQLFQTARYPSLRWFR